LTRSSGGKLLIAHCPSLQHSLKNENVSLNVGNWQASFVIGHNSMILHFLNAQASGFEFFDLSLGNLQFAIGPLNPNAVRTGHGISFHNNSFTSGYWVVQAFSRTLLHFSKLLQMSCARQ